MTVVARPEVAPWPTGTLLSQLSDNTRLRLTELGFPRSFRTGEQLLSQGATSRHVLLILSGSARVTVNTVDGRQTLLNLCRAGDVVGELAALDARPRSATVTAAEPTNVQVIARRPFIAFLAGDPAASIAVSRTIAHRLRASSQHRADLSGIPVRVRIARVLSDLFRPSGGRLAAARIPISQTELATLVGAAAASVHRELAWLRRSGSIETGYRCIMVRDARALDRMAWEDDPGSRG